LRQEGIEDFPLLLCELNENAINTIYNENYEKALAQLAKAQQLLEQHCIGNYRDTVAFELLTFHNLAMCYQK
jgi:hypothetical protein